MKLYFLFSLITLVSFFGASDGQTPQTEIRPAIFAPGVISGSANDGAPTFAPDGKTLYFARSGGSWGFIMESHLIGAAYHSFLFRLMVGFAARIIAGRQAADFCFLSPAGSE